MWLPQTVITKEIFNSLRMKIKERKKGKVNPKLPKAATDKSKDTVLHALTYDHINLEKFFPSYKKQHYGFLNFT
jgi:hypothetical protein